MTQFDFNFFSSYMTYRCGWCLDWILTGPLEKKPEDCPYCGADMSTKSPHYDEMIVRIRNDLKNYQLDRFLERLRQYQYYRKTKAYPPDAPPWSPLGMRLGGINDSWGSPLMKLFHTLEYLHKNPDAPDLEQKKRLVHRIGMQAFHETKDAARGFENMQNTFLAVVGMMGTKYTRELDKYRVLWNNICNEWKY